VEYYLTTINDPHVPAAGKPGDPVGEREAASARELKKGLPESEKKHVFNTPTTNLPGIMQAEEG